MFSAVSANDLCTGALVLASGVYPNLFRCWPLGERFCQIQVRNFALKMTLSKYHIKSWRKY